MNLSGQITEARELFRAPLSFNRQEAKNAKIYHEDAEQLSRHRKSRTEQGSR